MHARSDPTDGRVLGEPDQHLLHRDDGKVGGAVTGGRVPAAEHGTHRAERATHRVRAGAHAEDATRCGRCVLERGAAMEDEKGNLGVVLTKGLVCVTSAVIWRHITTLCPQVLSSADVRDAPVRVARDVRLHGWERREPQECGNEGAQLSSRVQALRDAQHDEAHGVGVELRPAAPAQWCWCCGIGGDRAQGAWWSAPQW